MGFDSPQYRQLVEEVIPFNAFLGLKLESLSQGRAVLRLPFRAELVGDVMRPALHGGSIAALIDATAGAAAFTEITPTDRVSTIDLRIDYLRPAPKQDLLATATVRRIGSRVATVNIEVKPVGDEALVAEGRAVFSVRRNVGPFERGEEAE